MKKTTIENSPENQKPVQDISVDALTNATELSEVDQLQAQIKELTNDLQRTRADFENFRKQVEAQKAMVAATTKDATVVKFLPLIDDFSRAFQTYPEQLAPLAKSFHKTLEGLDLAVINSEPGTEFDPDFHEAVSVEDGDGETEVIAETLRSGYVYDGDVIRPAMVKVKRI